MKELITKHIAAATLSTCSALNPKPQIINYEESYRVADNQITEYREYSRCTELLIDKPLPVMKLTTKNSDSEDVIEIYNDYVNALIEYIHDIKTECHPPSEVDLPIYK